MDKYYTFSVGGKSFNLCGTGLYKAVKKLQGFRIFLTDSCMARKRVVEAEEEEAPPLLEQLYPFSFEDVKAMFGRTDTGYILVMFPDRKKPLYLWTDKGSDCCFVCGNMEPYLLRFALWMAYGLLFLDEGVLAVHSSCVVYGGRAVMFLGESGTGKSTHTRLWCENIPGAFLLNDDSPVVRVEDGKVWVYGSPWSGKTPCYKVDRYPLEAVVRLSQAPENHMEKLPFLKAYGAIHPSCAPEFAYASELYDKVSAIFDVLLPAVPFYTLACLPDRAAAELSFRTVFSREEI